MRESVAGRPCHVLRVPGVSSLSATSVTEGLLVAWDAGGPLEEAVAACRQLHVSRVASRTHLVVLTRRAPMEAEALAEAGADECVLPPGSNWGARMAALTRRLAAERADADVHSLRRAGDFLRSALDAVPDPIFVKDRQHRFIAVNSAFCQVMGTSADQLLGRSDYDFVPAHEADVFWGKDEQVFRSGQPDENEETLTNPKGRGHIVVTKKAPFTSTDGEAFLVGVIRDITDRKRLESQLLVAERMASVGTLAAGVAHEINNPLAYVISNISFLRERLSQPELSPEQLLELREVVAEAEEGAGRVRSIVRDLRTFARAEEDRHGPVDVARVVDAALRLVRNELSHRARLVCSLEPVPRVHGNELRLSQVVVNLLVNALQALPERAVEENLVRVSLRAGRGQVELEVFDNGHGMPPDVQRRIFDPFFTTRPVGEGTGLGLSIGLSLVQAMGGRIEVTSAPGWGSSFRVVLPALVAEAPASSEGAPACAPCRVAPRRRLLLIDDEPSVGNAVSRLVRDVYEVRAVQDAREALQLLASGERFDAILCDLMMPGMSGMDFVMELERQAPELALRTGLMTGGAFTAQAREFVGRHSRGLLEKPFERDRLCTFVEHLLQ
nr:hybrid sensor histidine kinase/response regulator [Myxococcus sp. RHSTA-1-4]